MSENTKIEWRDHTSQGRNADRLLGGRTWDEVPA